jgi:hypothetical protein
MPQPKDSSPAQEFEYLQQMQQEEVNKISITK